MGASHALISGFWTWDVQRDIVYGDEQLADYFGQQSIVQGRPIADFLAAILDVDRNRVFEAIQAAVRDHTTLREFYRVRTTSYGIRRILVNGRCFYDDDGRPSAFPGTFIDVGDGRVDRVAPQLALNLINEAQQVLAGREGETAAYIFEMLRLELEREETPTAPN